MDDIHFHLSRQLDIVPFSCIREEYLQILFIFYAEIFIQSTLTLKMLEDYTLYLH